MLDSLTLGIIDLETTGGSAAYDRIIEVGIKRVEQGRVVASYERLVNPECRIPPFITQLTGITNEAVEDAPAFGAIAGEIRRLLEGCVFVAHNARFDYGFIRHEFGRLEERFSAPLLCTVRLSRLLYPRCHHHDLSSVIERCGLSCERRHRALGDAEAVWSFLQHVGQTVKAERLQEAVEALLRRPQAPPNLAPEALDELPEGPGVYVFYGSGGMALYVGASLEVRHRVLEHFADDFQSVRSRMIREQVCRIQTHATAGELGAHLLESHLIKHLAPLYNKRGRVARTLMILKRAAAREGYHVMELHEVEAGSIDPEETLGIFWDRRQAKTFLLEQAAMHKLCLKRLGLERGRGACSAYHLKRCRGACLRLERPAAYNARLALALGARAVTPWPFAGPVVVEEHALGGTGQAFVLDRWRLVKAFAYDAQGSRPLFEPDASFDLTQYQILRRYLLNRRGTVRAWDAQALPSADVLPAASK